jgi:hypothetical protein
MDCKDTRQGKQGNQDADHEIIACVLKNLDNQNKMERIHANLPEQLRNPYFYEIPVAEEGGYVLPLGC